MIIYLLIGMIFVLISTGLAGKELITIIEENDNIVLVPVMFIFVCLLLMILWPIAVLVSCYIVFT